MPAAGLLLAGILLLIPGFISDVATLFMLIPPLGRALSAALGRIAKPPGDGDVVDLPPEQWHQVPDPSLPDQSRDQREYLGKKTDAQEQDRRSQKVSIRKTMPSLFPPRPYVSQPPRDQVLDAKECS